MIMFVRPRVQHIADCGPSPPEAQTAVVRLIHEAKLLEIGGERAKRMKHALVVHAREGGYKFFATDMERVEAMERRLRGTTAV